MQEKNGFLLALLLLVVAAGVVFWLSKDAPDLPGDSSASPESAAGQADVPDAPRYPVPAMPAVEARQLRPLPPLDESDEYLRLDIADVFCTAVAEQPIADALIERLVATIDNLPRQRVAERVRPVQPLETAFAVIGQDDSGQYVLGEDNFQRYDALVSRFGAVDVDEMVELYRRYYPLFQKAYQGLGYPNAYFNDRLIDVLDHLLETPDVSGNILLVRPHVLYEFDDENLEALSGGQKLLIRIGPRHRATVMSKLREFRERVAFDKQ